MDVAEPDRLWANAKQFRRLFDAQSLDHPCDKDGAINSGKTVCSLFDKLQDLPLRHRLLRIGRITGELDDFGPRCPLGGLDKFSRLPIFAKTSECLIDNDAGKPGGQRGIAAELVKMPEGKDVGFLNNILGFAVVAHYTPCEPVEPLIVRLHDRAEGIALARQRTPNEVHVAGNGAAFRFDRCLNSFHWQPPYLSIG